MMMTRILQFVPVLLFAMVYIGVFVCIIWLFSRFVSAVEKIAKKIENSDKI